MNFNIKNAILFAGIALALILIYVFFIKGEPDEANLVSSPTADSSPQNDDTLNKTSPDTDAFLGVLLSIKNIKLDDSIFLNTAFLALRDSSIILTPDGNEGRPNPFAPIGSDAVEIPAP